MQLLFVVNRVADLSVAQATTQLMQQATRRGHAVWACGVADLALLPDGAVTARAVAVGGADDGAGGAIALKRRPRVELRVHDVDRVLIRTNPGRDGRNWAHHTALMLLDLAREAGVDVRNDPRGLLHTASKMYLSALPVVMRPKTLVSADPAALVAFCKAFDGPTVLKPLRGSHGQNVFLIRGNDRVNLRQIAEVLVRDGYAVAQAYLPEATDGDVRLVLMNGAPIVINGQVCAVRRVPAGDDFRSNVHAGGRAVPVLVDARMLAVADAIGARLRRDGVFLAGLDLIGGKAVEINVYSAGGMQDASTFYGVDFVDAVINGLEQPALRG